MDRSAVSLLLCVFYILVIVPAPSVQDPDSMLLTKFRLLLADNLTPDLDLIEQISVRVADKSSINETTPKRAPSLTTTPNMGSGLIAFGANTRIEGPDQSVYDRQRLMAHGLFDLHIDHTFSS